MRILALEMDIEKLKKDFLTEGEEEVFRVRNHMFKFVITFLWVFFYTLFIIGAAVTISYAVGANWFVVIIGSLLWIFTALPSLLRALVDWLYDLILVTTDKAVLIDQSSIFRQRVTPINLENFASVSSETQFLNLFNFGKLRFHLKSGLGEDLILPYTKNAAEAANKIANAVTVFQRRKDLRRYVAHEEPQ